MLAHTLESSPGCSVTIVFVFGGAATARRGRAEEDIEFNPTEEMRKKREQEMKLYLEAGVPEIVCRKERVILVSVARKGGRKTKFAKKKGENKTRITTVSAPPSKKRGAKTLLCLIIQHSRTPVALPISPVVSLCFSGADSEHLGPQLATPLSLQLLLHSSASFQRCWEWREGGGGEEV